MSNATGKILVYPDPALRTKAEDIKKVDGRVITLAENMATIMYEAPGIGLAAPQLGVSEKLIVVDVEHPKGDKDLITLVNPQILDMEGTVVEEEGCLSLPGLTEPVSRAQRCIVRGYDLNQRERTIEAEGLLAIVLQHEIDHLHGILFIDRLSSLKRGIIQRKIRKMMQDTSSQWYRE